MNKRFEKLLESLEPKRKQLMAMCPAGHKSLPADLPKQGVYLFSENGAPVYVGRSNNIRARYGMHQRPGSNHNAASFAFLLARLETGQTTSLKMPRAKLVRNKVFAKAFTQAKDRIRSMQFRAVEETDQTRQALLEIYCATVLDTEYNNFATH